jgi:hypothetical protein
MTWLVWRQHRHQAYIAAAALAAFAVAMLVTGRPLASQYQSVLRSCAASHTCASTLGTLSLGASPALILLVALTVAVPCVMGMFWGGPLVARELETGTSQFAWMQSVTRRRWLTVNVGWVLLAAAAWGGAVSALVTWWSSPLNALNKANFQPGQFDIQGIVPVSYALFAVALGIAAGALLRRTLPALAATLVVFTIVRLVIGQDLRSHYLTAVTIISKFGHPVKTPTGSYWQLSQGLVGPHGQLLSTPALSGTAVDGVPISEMPSACRTLAFQDPLKVTSCLVAHGYRGVFTSYQPAGRYWAFQGIESGIYVLLAAALIAVTAFLVLRRDA